MNAIIAKIARREDLSEAEAAQAMAAIMDGRASEVEIAAFLMGLRVKGETAAEITGCARVMREKAVRIEIDPERVVGLDREEINVDRETLLDTCGTGGDGTNTFNISTATAFVAAGGGCLVAKHGNRSVSSACGSADVVRCLGVNIDTTPAQVKECVERVGIGFLYAPLYHSAMKYALPVRTRLGIRTILNLLGPLTNPAAANVQLLGVYAPELTVKIALVLRDLGARSALVVHGAGSYDELSLTGETRVARLAAGRIDEFTVSPEDFGLRRVAPAEIRGGDAARNAGIILEVLKGAPGAPRDVVTLNAGAAFWIAGLAGEMMSGLELARDSIDSGRALERLEALIRLSNSFGA